MTFTATDDCGNASSTTATFTIEDTIAPDFTFVLPITRQNAVMRIQWRTCCGDACSAVTITEATDTTYGICAGEYVVTRMLPLQTTAEMNSGCASHNV